MARTKKFLTSNRRSSSRGGFYRPIKRGPVVPAKPKLNTQSAKTISTDEMQEIQDQIKEAEKLKQELTAKIQTQVKQSTQDVFSQLDEIISTAQSKTKKTSSEPEFEPTNNIVKKPASVLSKSKIEEEDDEDDLHFASDRDESKIGLLERELQASLKKARQREKELDELKASFESEKDKMNKTIKSLKSDLKEHTPITENKFFTISKELGAVVESMNKLLENENIFEPTVTPSAQPPQPVAPPPTSPSNPEVKTEEVKPQQPQANPPASEQTSQPQDSEVKVESVSPKPADTTQQPTQPEVENKKKFKIPKPVTILGSTFLIVLLIGGILWFTFFNSSAEVDAELVNQYLPEGSQVPDQAVQQPEEKPEATAEPQVQGASTSSKALEEHVKREAEQAEDRYTESQSDVTFTDTQWDTLKDSVLGYEITYPKNSINIVKTDASVTFIRKTGYIFKIQLFKTDLDVEEYWKLISGTSLKYKVNKTTFREKDALFLELEDFTDYPGDKYLVKHGDYIFDIWYATYSKTLSDDDLKRIDIMLNSFKFLD